MADDFLITPEDVSEIVAILSETKYERLEVATTRFRLLVTRSGAGWTQEWKWNSAAAADASVDTTSASAEVAAVRGPEGSSSVAKENGDFKPIASVMPGTFYRTPQPGAAPFVTEGDRVTEETVIGIVETMKLM